MVAAHLLRTLLNRLRRDRALQARQLYQLARRNAARGAMRQLLQAVESTGYVRMVIDQPGLRPALQLADNAYAGWLLAQRVPLERSISVTNFSRRAAEILMLLAEGLGSQQIAEYNASSSLLSSKPLTFPARRTAKMEVVHESLYFTIENLHIVFLIKKYNA